MEGNLYAMISSLLHARWEDDLSVDSLSILHSEINKENSRNAKDGVLQNKHNNELAHTGINEALLVSMQSGTTSQRR